jgi:TRAP-type C4-dicarboxylate transport system permease small subunit
MSRTEKAYRATASVSRRLTLLSGYVLLGAALLVSVDVLTRRLFNYSIAGADELSGYALAIATSFGLAYATIERSHIRMDVVYRLFPRSWQAVLDVVAVLALLAAGALFLEQGLFQFLESARFGVTANTPLRTPLWIPQAIWIVGLGLFVLVCLVVALTAIRRIVARDYSGASDIAGVPSVTNPEQVTE